MESQRFQVILHQKIANLIVTLCKLWGCFDIASSQISKWFHQLLAFKGFLDLLP